jgi:hypothetical protein
MVARASCTCGRDARATLRAAFSTNEIRPANHKDLTSLTGHPNQMKKALMIQGLSCWGRKS